jgi:signal transduction histidine kinase
MTGPWPLTVASTRRLDAMSDPEERDYRIWLRGVEKRAILPLKWAIFATSLIFWLLSHRTYLPPPVTIFSLFTCYFMFNLGETYLLLLNRVSLKQTRIVCIVSYYVDVAFVTLLIYSDARLYPPSDATSTDFYIFYVLLILRGFALFRTARANLVANAVVAAIFIVSLFWQETSLLGYGSRNTLIRIVFIWLVILMSWFIVQVITRQKNELIRTREKLVQSENMAMLGELASGVAHEINNPIGVISAYAEFLERNCPEGDERREDFRVIHSEALRCEDIVKELLHYARPSSHERTPTDLPQLNDEVIEFVKRRHEARSEFQVPDITTKYDHNLPLVMVDPAQVKQALLNIYLNAFQALQGVSGPILSVSLKAHDALSSVTLCVEDNGPGIPGDALKRIFDPFFTTRAQGTGLGLSITRRIIEANGGSISVRSKQGKGTSIELVFPVDGIDCYLKLFMRSVFFSRPLDFVAPKESG